MSNPPGQWTPPPQSPGPQYDYPPSAPAQQMQAAMAGFWRRLVALIIDSIVVGVVAGLVSVAIEALLHVTTTNGSSGIRGTVQFILGLIYFGWLWSTRGQTLGYMAMGMRLARVDGTQIGVGRALLRYILIELSFGFCLIPAIVSAFMVALGERKQAIHDLLVDTVVIRT